MSTFKKALALLLVVALTAAIAVSATLAYLADEDSDVNVMTMGSVKITQYEYERVVNPDGTYAMITSDRGTGYKLQEFTDDKPLYPSMNQSDAVYDSTQVNLDQLETGRGAMDVFTNKLAVDKFVFVKNTGSSSAYVRTLIAYELGSVAEDNWSSLIMTSNHFTWDDPETIGVIEVEDSKYIVLEYVYKGYNDGNTHHAGGILPAGEFTYNSLAQVYMTADTTNEDVEALDGNENGKYDILVLSQAVQTAGFASPTTALDTAFGDTTPELAAKWFDDIYGIQVTATNIESIDFSAANQTFSLSGEFGDIAISKLGEGSVIAFDDATIGNFSIAGDAVVEGSAKIESIDVTRNSDTPVEFTIRNANLDIEGAVKTENTTGLSVLNIEDSRIESGFISVGSHVNNNRDALAELNIVNSYVSCEENSLGSTISVWGRSGVKAKIYDSEIYTYSRGWHQSEDANDNSITFQGATSIDVDIQRSNMHLYGARSIVNVRQYGSEATTINARIDESLIWVVTKSSHQENTLPVWGFGEDNITNSMLLFTKNVHQSTPAVFKSFVFGNPVIHGDYHVTTQCQWEAPIALADGQTVTFASNANVSIYDGASSVRFDKTGSAKVVLEAGAVVKNIRVD